MVKNIDPRQVERFLEVPRIAREQGETLGTYVQTERGKTKWVGEGNVILPSGEFIKGEEFRGLPSDEQELLSRLGVESFNRFREENVKCETGEWYPRSDFEKLDDVERGVVYSGGTKGLEEFRGSNVRLGTGEWLEKSTWDSLPETHRNLLNSMGIEGYNDYIASNIQLGTGEWYSKSKYEGLKDWEQSSLYAMGIQGFSDFKVSNEYKVLEATSEGYRTYEDLRQVTGLTNSQIDKAIETLKKKGLLQ